MKFSSCVVGCMSIAHIHPPEVSSCLQAKDLLKRFGNKLISAVRFCLEKNSRGKSLWCNMVENSIACFFSFPKLVHSCIHNHNQSRLPLGVKFWGKVVAFLSKTTGFLLPFVAMKVSRERLLAPSPEPPSFCPFQTWRKSKAQDLTGS